MHQQTVQLNISLESVMIVDMVAIQKVETKDHVVRDAFFYSWKQVIKNLNVE